VGGRGGPRPRGQTAHTETEVGRLHCKNLSSFDDKVIDDIFIIWKWWHFHHKLITLSSQPLYRMYGCDNIVIFGSWWHPCKKKLAWNSVIKWQLKIFTVYSFVYPVFCLKSYVQDLMGGTEKNYGHPVPSPYRTIPYLFTSKQQDF
jgi:hypothetical protein